MRTRFLFPGLSARRGIGLLGLPLILGNPASAQETPAPVPPAPAAQASPQPAELSPGAMDESDTSAAAALSFYDRPGAAVMPSPRPGLYGGHCLPYRTPWPCGIGPTDCCVELPYTGFLFYGTDPRDDDPVNHTWTTCVGDQGNHAAQKTMRHARRFGY